MPTTVDVLLIALCIVAVVSGILCSGILAFVLGMPAPLFFGLALLAVLAGFAVFVGYATAIVYGTGTGIFIGAVIGVIFWLLVDFLVLTYLGTGILDSWYRWRHKRYLGLGTWKNWTGDEEETDPK